MKIPDGGSRHVENHKNRDISAAVWPIFTKFGMLMQNDLLTARLLKKFEFYKSKMADGRHFKNRYIILSKVNSALHPSGVA